MCNRNQKDLTAINIALGSGIGIALGAAFGDVALGLCVGAAIGCALSADGMLAQTFEDAAETHDDERQSNFDR